LILMLSADQQVVFKPLIYGLAGIIFLSGVYLVFRICRASISGRVSTSVQVSTPSLTADTELPLLPLSLLLGVFMTPLVVPHMFLYDFCLFTVAGPIAFYGLGGSGCDLKIKQLVIAAWLLIDLYTIVVMGAAKIAQPLLFVSLLFVLFGLMYKSICTGQGMPADKPTTPAE